MKFNQWTVGLAALGLISLASAAKAEEKANAVGSALSSTTISGYVDTSAQWNPGTGNYNMPNYTFGGADKADGFNLNVVQLRLEKPLDEAEWAAGYRVDLWAGPDANTLATQTGASGDFAIRQAYVGLRTPVGNGITWKMGVFDSILGYESVESPSNPNYTRSYGFTLTPTTHTGLLGTYQFSDLISASLGIANTYGPTINERGHYATAESYKSYMASIGLTAPEDMGFLAGSTLYAGILNGFDGGTVSETTTTYYLGTTIATPVAGLRTGASLNVVDVLHTGGESWSTALYASYQATEKMSFHARGEYLKDRGDQQLLGMDSDKILGVTGTVQYDLWENVLSRLEVRWDHSLSGTDTFGGDTAGGAPTLDNAWMVALNVIYKF